LISSISCSGGKCGITFDSIVFAQFSDIFSDSPAISESIQNGRQLRPMCMWNLLTQRVSYCFKCLLYMWSAVLMQICRI